MKEQSPDPSPGALGGGFVRSVLTLASGTAVAQLLLALAVPVLARLYTPAEYGVLAVYSSILTVRTAWCKISTSPESPTS